jgi:hypothetical protein
MDWTALPAILKAIAALIAMVSFFVDPATGDTLRTVFTK